MRIPFNNREAVPSPARGVVNVISGLPKKGCRSIGEVTRKNVHILLCETTMLTPASVFISNLANDHPLLLGHCMFFYPIMSSQTKNWQNIEVMWVKQSTTPFLRVYPLTCGDFGIVYYCFNHMRLTKYINIDRNINE